MKVILLEDVKSHGKKGDVINVSDGYARNLLIPKKLGVEATAKNLNELKQKKTREDKIAAENMRQAESLAEEIKKCVVTVYLKSGSEGKVFGSVSAKEICDAAKAQFGLDIDRKKLQMKGPIKELGETQVTVKLNPKVSVPLKVNVAGN